MNPYPFRSLFKTRALSLRFHNPFSFPPPPLQPSGVAALSSPTSFPVGGVAPHRRTLRFVRSLAAPFSLPPPFHSLCVCRPPPVFRFANCLPVFQCALTSRLRRVTRLSSPSTFAVGGSSSLMHRAFCSVSCCYCLFNAHPPIFFDRLVPPIHLPAVRNCTLRVASIVIAGMFGCIGGGSF